MSLKKELGPPWLAIWAVAGTIALCLVAGVVLAVVIVLNRPRRVVRESPVVRVELKQLQEDWRSNPVATHGKYVNAIVEFEAVVHAVDGSGRGSVEVFAPGESGALARRIRVRLSPGLLNEMAAFPRGSPIVLRVRIPDASEYMSPVAMRVAKPSAENAGD